MNPDADAEKLGFCADCPDHEACATGYTCATVKMSAASSAASAFKTAMLGVAEAAMRASAALTPPTAWTMTTRPRVMGGMEGDIVQHVSTTVAMDADRQIVERVVDEAEVIIRDYARTYGYRVIGAIDARSRVRNDTIPEIEVIVEARLRPITDGIWGEIRKAREEDKADLEAVQRDPLGLSADTSFASGGMVLGFDGREPSWAWSAPAGEYAIGTMSLAGSGTVYVYDGSNWIPIAAGTVD